MSHRPLSARTLAVGLIVAATAIVPMSVTPAGAARRDGNSTLSELQRQREQVRKKAASKASEVNTLKASDADISAALDALERNVSAQRDQLTEAKRAVSQAKARHDAAVAAQKAKQKELDDLHAQMKSAAIDSYINLGSSDMTGLSSNDINDTLTKRTLMSMSVNENLTLTEQFRSVQEDLETQRQIAEEAHKSAEQAKTEVSAKLAELDIAYAEQQAFASKVDDRLNAALAEADALAQVDAGLAKSISAKQAAIAKQLAAQRAAAAAQARSSSGRSSRSSAGGGSVPNITGSGEIVSVNGIRIHRSMANNLARLLAAAAADGIHLSGGGYRDPSAQIAVRKRNCGTSNYAIYQMSASSCHPPTARPGTSMHERGLAVDFTQNGASLTRSSSGYRWMKAHAGSYGFYNLPSEAWHWSSNGN